MVTLFHMIHGRKEWEYYYFRETLERQKAFFDYFLKGIENDWMDTPTVLLEVRNRFFNGQFRYENEWPIARTQATPLYLDGNDMSLSASPIKEEVKVVYDADLIINMEEKQKKDPADTEKSAKFIENSFLTKTGRILAESVLLKERKHTDIAYFGL